MDRIERSDALAGQAQHPAGAEDVVDLPEVLCDSHGVVGEEGDHRSGEPVEADGQVRPAVEPGEIEPPVILAMNRKEATALINLLNLSDSPEIKSLLYRLSVKYIMCIWPEHNWRGSSGHTSGISSQSMAPGHTLVVKAEGEGT